MRRAARWALIASTALASLGFLALAVWQVERRAWKLDLIARIEQRLQQAPEQPPAPEAWAAIGKSDEYRRVRLTGQFLPGEVLVQATTALGGGYWVMAPLQLTSGPTVLVNRGFVPPQVQDPAQRAAPTGPVTLVGLLRLTEPGGGPLRHNMPAEGRWYSRDVAGLAGQLGLSGSVAPFFVDEAADPAQPAHWPRPGLTVLNFPNNHAVYAATWLALALMSAAASVYLGREERRQPRP